ncbi:hypothetical protein ELH39_07965 [Rhizobium ruizarguesonis]|uniref:hypothetical protein n=1 Tax=Rhizobium ruizarguesonis TaxID=2081791 RepID=UPI001030A8F1|nr:hypothetical protein [Rhizobium ruizarguesonis]TBB97184.1 hypothetical protein ELH39_07965 [Rhizobium ruizarguesonis]
MSMPPRRRASHYLWRLVLVVLVFVGSVTSAPTQEVQAAIALIQLLRSFNSDGGSYDWIHLEFDALNVKIDTVIANEERLAKGLELLSQQIENAEKSIAKEMNAKPYKDLLYKILLAQNRVNDLANAAKNYEAMQEPFRSQGFDAARKTLAELKTQVPDALSEAGAIDSVYQKLRYSIIARTGSLNAQLIYNIALLDAYLSTKSGGKSEDRAWYVARYSAIEQGIKRFIVSDRISKERDELLDAYYYLKMPTDPAVKLCFSIFGPKVDYDFLSVVGFLDRSVDPAYSETIDTYLTNRYQKTATGQITAPLSGVEFACGTREIHPDKDGGDIEKCYKTAPVDDTGPGEACSYSKIREVDVFMERLQFGDAMFKGSLDTVPYGAVLVLDSLYPQESSDYWVIPYKIQTPGTPNLIGQEKRSINEGFVNYFFDKIIERRDEVPEKWARDCLGAESEPTCEDDPIPVGTKPQKFATTISDFAALSSAAALEVVDFDHGVADLKKLQKDIVEEIQELSKQ